MPVERVALDWPIDETVVFTLDYECDYGTALSQNTYQALEYTEWLVELLERLEVPLTCFVQTEILVEAPERVDELRSADVPVTFHPHSHTHMPREKTDPEYEIRESTARYREFFGRRPSGYRSPNGNVHQRDYATLAEYCYRFDASVFPSWRPGHFDNRGAATRPRYLGGHDLYEIPFTVYSDAVRVPMALSYCRLLGRPFTELLIRRPPGVVIFNVHMHDLFNPPAFEDLSPFYRAIYTRNAPGLPLLERVITRFRDQGYSFRQVEHIYKALADSCSA